jgi:hypothetical protein
MDLRELGCKVVDWISWLEWGPVAGCCEHDDEPLGSLNGGEFFTS